MESLTGMWVNFFTAAGIPSDVGATYAITFTENRIQNDMLLDLNKEYLRDMGISRMGDVIAILRHAKLVHENTARDRVLSTASPGPRVPVAAVAAQSNFGRITTAAVPSPPKSSSPASRMLGHYTRNSRTPPASSAPSVPASAASATSSSATTAAAASPDTHIKRRIIDTGESSNNVKKARLIEIKTNTSARPAPAISHKKNVFSRLGATSESGKTESANSDPESKTIFSRLGNKNITVDIDGTQRRVKQEVNDQVLQYEGILKNQAEIKKVVFNSAQSSTVRKSANVGTMRADRAPVSVKEKLAVTKSVKFSSHVDYKLIEPIPKKKIFFQSISTEVSKPAPVENLIFNKSERRLAMPSASSVSTPEVKARLGAKTPPLMQTNVFKRLGHP